MFRTFLGMFRTLYVRHRTDLGYISCCRVGCHRSKPKSKLTSPNFNMLTLCVSVFLLIRFWPMLAKCSEQSGAKHVPNVPNVPHVPNVPNTNIVPVQHRGRPQCCGVGLSWGRLALPAASSRRSCSAAGGPSAVGSAVGRRPVGGRRPHGHRWIVQSI